MKNKKIYAEVNLDEELVDRRIYHNQHVFGRVNDVATQYGISFSKYNDGFIFEAPKSRLQIFAEKLHFSRIEFEEIT